MKLLGFDMFVTKHSQMFTNSREVVRPIFSIEQGNTPDDWEIYCDPWYAVVSRMGNRKGSIE